MNKSEYKKIGKCWNTDADTISNDKIDSFYRSSETCTGSKKSAKKSKKKSNHKHDYEEVLLRVSYVFPLTGKETKNLHLGKRCKICGLIKETDWFILEECENGYLKTLKYDEIIAKYPDLEIVDYYGE